MQLLKLLSFSLLLASCSRQSAPPVASAAGGIDTVFLPAECPTEVWVTERVPYLVIDSAMIRRNDSLYSKLLVANYKLERVQFYLNIVNRNPSQVKFLRGWINRALEE